MTSIQKFNIAILTAFLVMVFLGFMSYRHNAKLLESAAWVEQSHVAIGDIEDILSDIYNAERLIRGYAITGKSLYVERFQGVLDGLQQDMKKLREMMENNPRQMDRIQKLERSIRARYDIFQQTIALKRERGTDVAELRAQIDRGTGATESIKSILAEMEAEEMEILRNRSQEELRTARRTRGVLVLGTVVALGVVAGAAYLIRREAAAAQRALEVKSHFVSMVSHELRTPLSAIKEGIGVVLDGTAGVVTAEQSEFLSLAKRNVDRLHQLINDILDFSKLNSGKVAYHFKENDLNGTVREVAAVLNPMARSKNLDLLLELDPGLKKFSFDNDKMVQVLTNLLNNALKFTSRGAVTVTTQNVSGKKEVRVSVRDTGVGVRQEDLGRIFQEFQQVGDSSFYRKPGSTGLGLSICREIVNGHGGRIWAESEFGKGSEFFFVLPTERRDESAST